LSFGKAMPKLTIAENDNVQRRQKEVCQGDSAKRDLGLIRQMTTDQGQLNSPLNGSRFLGRFLSRHDSYALERTAMSALRRVVFYGSHSGLEWLAAHLANTIHSVIILRAIMLFLWLRLDLSIVSGKVFCSIRTVVMRLAEARAARIVANHILASWLFAFDYAALVKHRSRLLLTGDPRRLAALVSRQHPLEPLGAMNSKTARWIALPRRSYYITFSVGSKLQRLADLGLTPRLLA
jgi:hypothetical protein